MGSRATSFGELRRALRLAPGELVRRAMQAQLGLEADLAMWALADPARSAGWLREAGFCWRECWHPDYRIILLACESGDRHSKATVLFCIERLLDGDGLWDERVPWQSTGMHWSTARLSAAANGAYPCRMSLLHRVLKFRQYSRGIIERRDALAAEHHRLAELVINPITISEEQWQNSIPRIGREIASTPPCGSGWPRRAEAADPRALPACSSAGAVAAA